ncbi:putative NBPF family member NBPF5 [Equus asinus]|uniref:putative NBPF family member NBPF5 n=1 Tax=Equus asinus TaxID=9793 RepID=UPI0038F665E7
MAVCPHALSDPRAEVTLQESNQELRSQLAQSKQDFQALMEEFLVSEAAAYSLATELQKHKCGECKDIIESVLGDKLPFEEGKLAEESTLAKKLRESNLLIQEQEQQLAYLRHKLQEGREVWALLSQHLNDLLTHNGSDDHQGQAFRQQLAEGYRLAKHLAHILGPGNNEDKEDEKTQGTLTHRLGGDVPPTVEPPLPRACLEEYSWTCATDVGQSESCWTQSSSAVFCFQGLAVSSLADTPSEYCRCAGDKAPAGLPGRSVSLACQPSGCADRHIEGNQAGGRSWKHRRETLEGAALPSFLPGYAQVPLAPVTHHGTQSRQDKLSSPVPYVAPGQILGPPRAPGLLVDICLRDASRASLFRAPLSVSVTLASLPKQSSEERP